MSLILAYHTSPTQNSPARGADILAGAFGTAWLDENYFNVSDLDGFSILRILRSDGFTLTDAGDGVLIVDLRPSGGSTAAPPTTTPPPATTTPPPATTAAPTTTVPPTTTPAPTTTAPATTTAAPTAFSDDFSQDYNPLDGHGGWVETLANGTPSYTSDGQLIIDAAGAHLQQSFDSGSPNNAVHLDIAAWTGAVLTLMLRGDAVGAVGWFANCYGAQIQDGGAGKVLKLYRHDSGGYTELASADVTASLPLSSMDASIDGDGNITVQLNGDTVLSHADTVLGAGDFCGVIGFGLVLDRYASRAL